MIVSYLPTDAIKGVLWMLVWAFSFSLAMTLVKFLSPDVSSPTVVCIRNLSTALFLLPAMLRGNEWRIHSLKFYLLRLLFLCLAMLCTYHAYRHLPLAFATCIGFTGPFMTTLLSMLVLRSRVHPRQFLLMGLSYAGVLVMMNPQADSVHLAVLVALGANFFASCSILATKKLTSTDSTQVIMFYSCLGASLLFGAYEGQNLTSLGTSDCLLLVGIGALGIVLSGAQIQALKASDPAFLAPFEYSRLVFAIPLAYLLLDEVPTWRTAVGAFVILSSVVLQTRGKLGRVLN